MGLVLGYKRHGSFCSVTVSDQLRGREIVGEKVSWLRKKMEWMRKEEMTKH